MISTQPGLIMVTHTNPLHAGWKPDIAQSRREGEVWYES
jgi:hypothetical protein